MVPDERGNEPTDEYLSGVRPESLLQTDAETLTLTPAQHATLKSRLNGEELKALAYSERKYLVVGKGGDSGPARRRERVCSLLDDRPDAIAFRLEDFGFTPAEIDLWSAAFEVLCERATHIVGVLEDFEGGYVWELGYLYRMQTTTRDILWLLKRIYEDETVQREKYDNGMATSHLEQLEAAVSERVVTWHCVEELPAAVENIP